MTPENQPPTAASYLGVTEGSRPWYIGLVIAVLAVGAGGSFRRARSLARRNADRSGDTMNTFTSHDLKADAFPQVGVDPLDVQRGGSRVGACSPNGLQMRV